MAYIGRQQDGFGVRSRFIYTATGGQTTFDTDDSSNALSYSDGAYVDVYLNGVLLDPSDYTATSLTSIVLDAGAAADDVLEVIVYDVFSVFSGTFTNGITASEATITNGISAGSATVTGDLTVDTDTLFVDASADAVGINKSAPAIAMDIVAADNSQLRIDSSDTNDTTFFLDYNGGGATNRIRVRNAAGDLAFNVSNTSEAMRIDSSGNVDLYQGNNLTWRYAAGSTIRGSMSIDSADNITFSNGSSNTERMRLDSSGNLLVNKTSSDFGVTTGLEFLAGSDDILYLTSDDQVPLLLRRNSTDGTIALFRKDGTTVGSIGTSGQVYIAGTSHALKFFSLGIQPANTSGANTDNSMDIGASSTRFDDIYATNGTIQTSDQNEKCLIVNLIDAEIAAAKRISNGFKKFKWNDAVAAKGDSARTHTGVIAQEVRTALEAEGLDAGDYAFFMSNTWWETQTEVPAVLEETDEEGNVIVEAQEAYTRTDTYDTAEEAPEGATERTRLGIRYPELLAFVGAATEQRLTHLETLEARIEVLENA